MLNVGVGELFVIFLIVLIAVGPDRLPEIARNLGKAYNTFQREMKRATDTFREAVDVPELREAAGVIDKPDPPKGAPVTSPAVVASPTLAEQAPVVEPPPSAPPEPPTPAAGAPESPVVRDYEDT